MSTGESVIAGFMFGLLLGMIFAFSQTDKYWQSQAIKRGHAEYNAQTGAWQWKEGK